MRWFEAPNMLKNSLVAGVRARELTKSILRVLRNLSFCLSFAGLVMH